MTTDKSNYNNLIVTMFNNQDIFNYGVKNFKALDPESVEEAIEDAVRACYNDFIHRFGLIHTAVTLENIGRMTAFTNGIPKVNLILDLEDYKLPLVEKD